MKLTPIYITEFWHEIRAGMRGPLFPITSIGLILYLLMVLANAEYMRDMGAAGIPRNSAHLMYQLSSGMSVWLYFIWAWVFGQAVLRDRSVNLHENVLTAPVSLQHLLLARYLGAAVVALLLGLIMPLSLFLVPVLHWMNLIPAELVGAMPIQSALWSLVVFILPSVIGIGALLTASALWMRNIAGPFLIAALLMLVWMTSLIALRGGDINDAIATLIDPTAFGEAEQQTLSWTPAEKISRLMDLTLPLLFNRILWTVLPLWLMLWLLWRTTREHLSLENTPKRLQDKTALPQHSVSTKTALPMIQQPRWWQAIASETRWHLQSSLQNWGLLLALGILVLMGVGGAIVHTMQHADGPIVPRAHFLMPFMAKFFYLYILFMVAGFVGTLMRRDVRTGFDEMLDATLSPIHVRVFGRALAAFALTLIFALTPTISAWVAMAIGAPQVEAWDALLYQALVIAPAMLEICAITLLIHALIRNTGTAYAVSMMFCFIALVNHELNMISYPPGQVGIPVHTALSSLSGWQPWLPTVLGFDAFKLSIVALLAILTWLAWPRGTDLHWRERYQIARVRLGEGAGWSLVTTLVLLLGSGALLYQRLVLQGEYQTQADQLADTAQWEKHWWQQANSFHVAAGNVIIHIDPESRSAQVEWRLQHVRTSNGLLHGSLPHAVTLQAASVNGQPVKTKTAHEHFAIPVQNCPNSGCNIVLKLSANFADWPDHDHQNWLHPSGVWLRAEEILPRLGHDPDKPLQAPAEREHFALPAQLPTLPASALQAAQGVAPSARWQWQVTFNKMGEHTQNQGLITGPLDFAVAWVPEQPPLLERAGYQIWHGKNHQTTAQEVLADVQTMQQCVSDLLGANITIQQVLQSPREMGDVHVYGQLLWLPEHLGWDIASAGFGRQLRRMQIAQALSSHAIAYLADLRATPGSRWLLDGVSGWLGMECVRRQTDTETWLALQTWQADSLVDALGSLSVPVVALADAGQAAWVRPYSALTTLNWAAQIGTVQATQIVRQVITHVRSGQTVSQALQNQAGQATANALLGMPVASDIALVHDAEQGMQVTAQRWQWRDGSWHDAEATQQVLVVAPQTGTAATTMPLAQLQQSTAQSFIALDQLPSYERTPEDNFWQP